MRLFVGPSRPPIASYRYRRNPDLEPLPELTYDGFQSPATGPASGAVSPESDEAIAAISAGS